MELIKQFGERWARNTKNIEDGRGSRKGGQGVYILYDGSTPVYVGKGNIRQRLRGAHRSRRQGNSWDHFSWYILKDQHLMHDVEVLVLRILPPFLRYMNRQRGHFRGVHSTDQNPQYSTPVCIERT